jgi:hypothetical protein
MPILTTDQAKRLGEPPRPPGPTVQRVMADGKPTAPIVEYESRLSQWLQRLFKILQE